MAHGADDDLLRIARQSFRALCEAQRRADQAASRNLRALLKQRARKFDREVLVPTTIRLADWTVAAARVVARGRRQRYQQVIRQWLEEAIRAFVRRNR